MSLAYMENVEKELDRLISKFKDFNKHGVQALCDLIPHIENYQRDLAVLTAPGSELTDIQRDLLIDNVVRKCKNTLSLLSVQHREMHQSVSRIGKQIDRNFVTDYFWAGNKSLFQEKENPQLLNKVIVEHFLRQGRSDIAEKLIQDAKLDIDSKDKTPYLQMNKILDALKNRNLEPALEWADDNREALAKIGSNFEFKLHRLQFIEMLRGNADWNTLINYSRTHLAQFGPKHSAEVQVLMGSLIYARSGIENSPYKHLLDATNWTEICNTFTKEACTLLEVSVDSPLSVTFNAGSIALPALINIQQAISLGNTDVWTSREELPIEIDVTRKCHYHSVFACPILRQQSNDSNPPMRLQCGHVISRDALLKLASTTKLKCPYCPQEQSPNDARLIHF